MFFSSSHPNLCAPSCPPLSGHGSTGKEGVCECAAYQGARLVYPSDPGSECWEKTNWFGRAMALTY